MILLNTCAPSECRYGVVENSNPATPFVPYVGFGPTIEAARASATPTSTTLPGYTVEQVRTIVVVALDDEGAEAWWDAAETVE